MRLDYAIVFVSDMKRSIEFYRDTLGIPLRFESPDWTEFATDGATLALHAGVGRPDPDDEGGTAGRCRPGLGVADLEQFHKRMEAAGVRCLQQPTDAFGARVAQYADPDGLLISVSERGEA